MQQNNSAITFTRSTKRDGLLSWPTVIFQLARSQDGREIGQLSIRNNQAEFISANHRDDFRVRRNFWANRWTYEGQEDRLFARYSLGFRPAIVFPDDTRYRLRIKRRWRFLQKADDEYTHLVTFTREDVPVMTLQNNQRMAFFSNEVHMPMSGVITTTLTDVVVISGLLLFFQSVLRMRHAAATAG